MAAVDVLPFEVFDKVAQVVAFKRKTNPMAPFIFEGSAQSRGSSFVVRDKGSLRLLTAAHVINNTLKIGGIRLLFPLIDRDHMIEAAVAVLVPEIDCAVLQLSPADEAKYGAQLRHLEWGDDKLLRIGDPLVVVGYPMGDDGVKITRSTFNGLQNGLIQMDSSINKGNSGCPVLNREGRIVGIVSAGYDPKVSNSVAFAIPISLFYSTASEHPLQYNYYDNDNVKDNANNMTTINKTKIIRMPSLGIMYYNSSDVGIDYGNPMCANGVGVQWVSKNSSLYGTINVGDRICGIKSAQYMFDVGNTGDVKVPWYPAKISLANALVHIPINQSIEVTYWSQKDKGPRTVQTTLKPTFSGGFLFVYDPFEEIDYEIFGGLVVMPLRMRHILEFPELQAKLTPTEREKEHLVVSYIFPNSKFMEGKILSPGDIIKSVNGKPVTTLAEYRAALKTSNPYVEWKTDDDVVQRVLIGDLTRTQQEIQSEYNIPVLKGGSGSPPQPSSRL